MKLKFEYITDISDPSTFNNVRVYYDELIDFATEKGYLDNTGADNKYTREIGRIGEMVADYESVYLTFRHLKV